MKLLIRGSIVGVAKLAKHKNVHDFTEVQEGIKFVFFTDGDEYVLDEETQKDWYPIH